MPSQDLHKKLDKFLFGREHPEVHTMLDLPSTWLGKEHRVLFHDEPTAVLMGLAVGGVEGAISALFHVWLDRAYTQTSYYVKRKFKLR
jgi:hypothetical protein